MYSAGRHVQENGSCLQHTYIRNLCVKSVRFCDNVPRLETNEMHASNASQSVVVSALSTVVYRHKKNPAHY